MIETPRLTLRGWLPQDRAPFAAMGQDPAVMEFLGPVMAPGQADAAIDRMIGMQADLGHCFWAIERKADQQFLGFCGLKPAPEAIPGITGNIEIGWRLAQHAWRQGFAHEAATASLHWGFTTLKVPRIIAITAIGNLRSQGLMRRLGMVPRPDLAFDHPALPKDSPLRPHLTFEAVP